MAVRAPRLRAMRALISLSVVSCVCVFPAVITSASAIQSVCVLEITSLAIRRITLGRRPTFYIGDGVQCVQAVQDAARASSFLGPPEAHK